MKNEFKALNQRIIELTQKSEEASAKSQLFAVQAYVLATQARKRLIRQRSES
ncbi:hypothetical protein D3C87_2188820 [compost metagenome]